MKQYLRLLSDILETGARRGDRTGTGTLGLFGAQLRFDLSQGFPLATTRKVFFKGVIHELLWFLNGETNIKYLTENKVHIWDAWADENGELGPIYGAQWRAWPAGDGRKIDQISQVIEQIKAKPESRRHLVSAWNPAVLPDESISPQANVHAGRAALASCHALFQFHVANGRLSCLLYQRSADTPVGLPFFCHITECYHAVLVNAEKGFMPLGAMIALLSPCRVVFPETPSEETIKSRGISGQHCFDESRPIWRK